MQISVEYDCLESESEALALLSDAGLHTLTLDVPAVDNSAHWHHFSSVFFILEGTLQLTDVNSGVTHECAAGTRISVPAEALHYEYSPGGYRIALGTTVPAAEFGDPVDLPPSSLGTR